MADYYWTTAEARELILHLSQHETIRNAFPKGKRVSVAGRVFTSHAGPATLFGRWRRHGVPTPSRMLSGGGERWLSENPGFSIEEDSSPDGELDIEVTYEDSDEPPVDVSTLQEARRGYAPEHGRTHTVPVGYRVGGDSVLYDDEGKVAKTWVKTEKEPDPDKPIVELPDGIVKRVSTMYDADGNPGIQWVRKEPKLERQLQALEEFARALSEPFSGASSLFDAPEFTDSDLLSVYPIGDAHIGMYSWHEETGEDFDLDIAERELCGVVEQLTSLSPPSEQALIVNVGDYFHVDGYANKTPQSGNPLDADSRWPKIVRTGVRIMRRLIDLALEKHQSVRVINSSGNHDIQASVFLSIMLGELYSNNERVEIDQSPTAYHYHRFGANLIGVTHGDKTKPDKLQAIMANDRASDWGETVHRVWYTGHVHHDQVKDLTGCRFESFRTLAPGDAWHVSSGYRARRDMKCIVHHRTHGEVKRHTVGLSQLTGAVA